MNLFIQKNALGQYKAHLSSDDDQMRGRSDMTKRTEGCSAVTVGSGLSSQVVSMVTRTDLQVTDLHDDP